MRRTVACLAFVAGLAAAQQPITRTVDFARYREARDLRADFELAGGQWSVEGRHLVGDSATSRAFASYVAAPLARDVTLQATITVDRRTNPESWVTAGLCLFVDSGAYWQLALVEGPDGKRYAELVEMYAGSWQAQREGLTKLEQRQFDGQFAGWEYGRPYRLRLKVDEHEIRGEVADAATGAVRTRLAYAWGDAPGVKEGRAAVATYGFRAGFEQLSITAAPPSEAASPVKLNHGRRGTLLLLDDPRPALDHQTVEAVANALTRAGFGVTRVGYGALADSAVLEPQRVDAVVLCDSRAYPPAGRAAMLRYLAGGGDLVLLGGRAFSETLYSSGQGWATQSELESLAAAAPDQVTLFDFEHGAAGWARVTNQPDAPTTLTVEAGPHGQCAKLEVKALSGWDNQQVTFPKAKAGDADALSIWLKGDAGTPKVALELGEEDGSRWITAVDVTTSWRRYVIPDWRFGYWRDSTSEGRGSEGDCVRFGQVRYLNVGQAFSHTGQLPGDHTVWFDQIGLAQVDLPRVTSEERIDLPVFSDYAVYRYGPTLAAAAPGQQIVGSPGTPLRLAGGWSAVGFAFPNESKFLSLLDARDTAGRVTGSALSLLAHYRGRYRDSVWLCSGVEEQAVYRTPAFLTALCTALPYALDPALTANYRSDAMASPADLALSTPAPHAGFIRKSADGKHLVYPDGRRFFMIGCNYVGHFDRCGGRMWLDDYYDPRIVEQDFKNAHDAGLNVMRYWLQGTLDADLRRGDLRKVNAIRECARKYGVYLLLDLYGTSYATEEAMVESHRNIAKAFADEPMVLGYDLRNEPYVTTLGGVRYVGEPVPVQSRDLRPWYPGKTDDETMRRWIAERPYWLHLPGWLTGDEALRLTAAWTLWGQYLKEHGLSSSTLPGLTANVPGGEWQPLVETVDASLDRWLKVQIAAIREVDANHMITVGHNTALTMLPANQQLDFVSEHIYARPYSYANVMENLTTLDRLATRWPDRPITLGEFGYSNGIVMAGGYLDDQTSAVGELAHYLYALAHGYDGVKKWMLCDWPLAIMKRYGDWDRGLETRIYEERFGLYSYDGTVAGRAKPIVPSLRFLREYVDETGPGGTLNIHEADNAIGTAWVYQGPGALFVGEAKFAGEALAFEADTPRNVMLRWNADMIRIMAAADTTVRLRTAKLVPRLTPALAGLGQADGEWLRLELLAGQEVELRRR